MCKKTKEEKPKELKLWFQKAIGYTTIGGAIVSAGLAWYAIYLTKEIAKADTSIQKLDSANSHIIKLIEESQNQQRKQDITNNELIKQNKVQNSELDILSENFRLTLEKDRLEKTNMYIEYDKSIRDLKDALVNRIIFDDDNFLNMTNEERAAIIHDIQAIIDKIDFYSPIINVDLNGKNSFHNEWTHFKFFFNYQFANDMTSDKYIPDNPSEQYEVRKKGIADLKDLFFKFQTDESLNRVEWQKVHHIEP